MKVTIECNERQADVIERALDFYMRILMGQFTEIHSCFYEKHYDRQLVDILLQEIKLQIFEGKLESNASYGIGSKDVNENVPIAYDVYQVLRHNIMKFKNPNPDNFSKWAIWYDTPMQESKEPLPKVVVKKG